MDRVLMDSFDFEFKLHSQSQIRTFTMRLLLRFVPVVRSNRDPRIGYVKFWRPGGRGKCFSQG
jgi:hypothetical protein